MLKINNLIKKALKINKKEIILKTKKILAEHNIIPYKVGFKNFIKFGVAHIYTKCIYYSHLIKYLPETIQNYIIYHECGYLIHSPKKINGGWKAHTLK